MIEFRWIVLQPDTEPRAWEQLNDGDSNINSSPGDNRYCRNYCRALNWEEINRHGEVNMQVIINDQDSAQQLLKERMLIKKAMFCLQEAKHVFYKNSEIENSDDSLLRVMTHMRQALDRITLKIGDCISLKE